ncbi:MAG: hypothetical protein OWU32_06345 [Firmicutes bacterium]|nr:hypothetical protein [Bacillota bacterium]
MAEYSFRQTIELFIDQQVFIDLVHGDEKVAEFSALTEVTSFEQRGESLYLEGNILFTAYVEQSGGSAGEPAAEPPDAVVEHIAHRMPFDVTVPVDAQIAGMLSVTVQVPDATVDILGPGWIHIRALAQVQGLSPDGGYTAHCGAQEAVVPAQGALHAPVNVAHPSQGDAAAIQASEADLSVATPEFPMPAAAPLSFSELVAPSLRAQERAQDDEAEAQEHDPAAGESLSEVGWKEQLAGADRALFGTFNPYRSGSQDAEAKPPLKEEVAHFHFEAVDLEPRDPKADPSAAIAKLKTEFENARSEWHDAVLQPAPEPAPVIVPTPTPVVDLNVNVNAVHIAKTHEIVEGSEPTPAGEVAMSYTAVPETQVNDWTAAQWFWNTLNIPAGESSYKMKFRIVHDEDTVDDLATRYQLSQTDLLRANPSMESGLIPGELLFIPGR